MAVLKCIIIGDPYVGKTCLIKRLVHSKFPDESDTQPTAMETFSTQVLVDGKSVTLNLWDTSGQFEDASRQFLYPHTDIFIVCYSLSSLTSLENVESVWVPEIRKHCPQLAVILLVGTKLDLRYDAKEQVKLKNTNVPAKCDGAEMRKRIKAAKYIECSACSGENIEKVFNEAVRSYILCSRPKRRKSWFFLC